MLKSPHRTLVMLTKDYHQQKSSIAYYHNEMKILFQDFPEIVGDLNKLLYADARITLSAKSIGIIDILQNLMEYVKNDRDKVKLVQEMRQECINQNLDQNEIKELILQRFGMHPEIKEFVQNLIIKKQKSVQGKRGNDFDYKQLNKRIKQDIKQEQQSEVQDVKLQNQLYFAQHFYVNNHQLQQNREIKTEIVLFDTIRLRMMKQFENEEQFNQNFNDFIKLIHLYTECIITHHELMEILNGAIDRELLEDLKIISQCRDQSRRQQSVLFKPLKDTDFKHSVKLCKSYVKVHAGYANSTNYQIQYLNQDYVSVPFGSEDYSFQIMRKNTYEEQLFKNEDEKFEFDHNMQLYRRTIKLLTKLSTEQNMSEEQIQKCVKQILDLKILQQIYKTSAKDQAEIVELWQKNPTTCSDILKQRVQQKQNEIQEARNNKAFQNWEQVNLNNFHRSLDHRSFYFKKNEKQHNCPSKYLKEPEERFQSIINHFIPDIQFKKKILPQQDKQQVEQQLPIPSDLKFYLNSLSQLTSYEPMSSNKSIPFIDQITQKNILNLPLFSLWLPDNQIIQECFQYLLHYAQIATQINSQERQWTSRVLVIIANSVFNIAINPPDFQQLIINQNQLKSEVLKIEANIFDVNFSYLQSCQEKEDIENRQQSKIEKENHHSSNQENHESHDQESEGQLSKMLTESPSQSEQDVFQASKFDENEQNQQYLKFLPQKKEDPNSISFFGTTGLYMFFRYFYSIYQRLEIAKDISYTFQDSLKTQNLDQEYIEEIGRKRYIMFKSALYLSLKSKEFQYEDYLRSIFGKQAFLLGTIEKLFQDCCKQLSIMHSDKINDSFFNYIFMPQQPDSNDKLLQLIDLFHPLNMKDDRTNSTFPLLFKFNKTISEEMQLKAMTYQILEHQWDKSERSIFRVTYSPQFNGVYLNYIPHWSTMNDKNSLQKVLLATNSYVTSFASMTHKPRVFLQRNYRKEEEEMIVYQGLEWNINENGQHRIAWNNDKTKCDVMISRKRKQRCRAEIEQERANKAVKFIGI